MIELRVCKTSSESENNTFGTISEALSALPPESCETAHILISPGCYHEKLEIKRDNLIIEGTGSFSSDTEITFDDCARDDMPDGTKRGTFRSYSVFIDAKNVTVKNLTISNLSGPENKAWQAIALYADGDGLFFENVRLISHQDTLFTGPLPPKELQPGGFIGPKQFDERIVGKQYYRNCYICGNVDFIFGSAEAVFEKCTIESIARSFEADKAEGKPVHGYVTAPSTPEGEAIGYIFMECDFVSKECPAGSVYLGRPWRDYAKAVFIDCRMGDHIKSEGFHDWGKPLAREESFFAIYNCFRENGQAYAASESFAKNLEQFEAESYIDFAQKISKIRGV